MQYSTLGNTKMKVSRIGLGTNAVGGANLFKNLSESNGIQMVEAALEQGITFIDTADAYGFGRSEELIGQVLHQVKRREQVVLATKGGLQRSEDGSTFLRNNRPGYLRSALETSLKRLRTDYVDVYYIHFPDGQTPLAEAAGELSRLQEEGKIGTVGVSNLSLEQLKEANRDGHIAVLQSPYHMLDRTAESGLLPYCVERHISFVPYGPLAFGILGGKYGPDFVPEEGDWRKKLPLFQPDTFRANDEKVQRLKDFCRQKDISLSELALSWLLHQPGIDAVIPGGKTADQVLKNVKASEVSLSADELKAIASILKS